LSRARSWWPKGILDAEELVGVLGAEDVPQPLGFRAAAAEAATAFEGGPQLGEGELRGLGRSRRHREDTGVSPGQTALLALEGQQSSRVVLAQKRADLVGDLLPGPDGVLLGAGQDADGLSEFGVGRQGAVGVHVGAQDVLRGQGRRPGLTSCG
jgi:hypothetical protein